MKRFYLLSVSLAFITGSLFAQAPNCTQTLRLVRSTYEQGRLHELPKLMENCLKEGGFTREERREALRYLTLAHIYLEEPEEADKSMLDLLNTDHFYQPNELIDPAEFISLWKKFRTDPLFRAGLKFGPNYTMPVVLRNYYVGSAAAGNGGFSPGIGFQLGLTIEKDFFKDKKTLKHRATLAAEINFVSGRSFSYDNPTLTTKDAPNGSTGPFESANSQVAEISQSWMDFNVLGTYRLSNNQFNWYVGGGPGINLLGSSSNQVTTSLVNTFTVTGPAVDDTKSFNKLNFSVIALAGGRLRVGEIFVTGEVRYQYGLNNIIKASTRSNPETLLDYGFQWNDFRINTVSVTVGILYPYFKPKKLIK